MAAVEVRLVAMGAVGATNSHPNMEEVITTSLQATALPIHKATVSRASMVKEEVRHGYYKHHNINIIITLTCP